VRLTVEQLLSAADRQAIGLIITASREFVLARQLDAKESHYATIDRPGPVPAIAIADVAPT